MTTPLADWAMTLTPSSQAAAAPGWAMTHTPSSQVSTIGSISNVPATSGYAAAEREFNAPAAATSTGTTDAASTTYGYGATAGGAVRDGASPAGVAGKDCQAAVVPLDCQAVAAAASSGLSAAAAAAMGNSSQLRIFTSEEKRIDDWSYLSIHAAREWFYQNRTEDEVYNKQLMKRIIRGDRSAGAQSAVVSYYIRKKDWALVKKGIKWYDVNTDLQWLIYLDCYRAAVTDLSNPNLPMLDRLIGAMSKIPTVGKEVEVLGSALEKGLLYLQWMDYIPSPRDPAELVENPRNLEVIKQFLNNIKASDRAKATFKQQIMEGQGIDDLGTCKSFWLMVGRMHLQIQDVAKAKTTLLGLGMSIVISGERSDMQAEGRGQGGRGEHQGARRPSQGGAGGGPAVSPRFEGLCAMCGVGGHQSRVCPRNNHPDANRANMPWKDSEKGKAWAAKGAASLPATRTLSGGPLPNAGAAGKIIPACLSCNSLVSSIPVDRDVLLLRLEANDISIFCRTLLDTGSLQATFMNVRTARRLAAMGLHASVGRRVRVCGAVGGCAYSGSSIEFSLWINNEITNREEKIKLCAIVLDVPQYDIIVGKPDVIKYYLIQKLWFAWANIARPMDASIDTRSYSLPMLEAPMLGSYKDKNSTHIFVVSDQVTELPLCHKKLQPEVVETTSGRPSLRTLLAKGDVTQRK